MSLSKVTDPSTQNVDVLRSVCMYQTLFLWDGTPFIGSLVLSFASAELAEALPVHLVDDGYH
jgi:hypothetical protein